ncbi:MAG TPA: c-type cytochrome [Verrucomicrobiae bacterium]|nr:c-type cytochrome [Verrucomicrobiae bacterium]
MTFTRIATFLLVLMSGAASAADAVDAARLGTLYVQTCMACHTSPGSGAPQAGDRAAWEPRLAQGMDALLAHTIDGHEGMPPLGSCMDCSEAEFEGLVRFMAGVP